MSEHTSDSSDRGTWGVLIEQDGPRILEDLEFFDDLAERIRTARRPDTGGANLGAAGSTIAASIVLIGHNAPKTLLAQIEPLLGGVINELMPQTRKEHRLDAFWTLSYLNAARCTGTGVPPDSATAEATWLPSLAAMRAQFSTAERHTLAFAASACGLTSLVATVLDAAPAAFVPGDTHGFNVQGFALALAAAIDANADYPDIELAWLDFVHRFPIKLDTDMLDWPALLWAARAVYATIGGIPVAEVGDELHRLVTGA